MAPSYERRVHERVPGGQTNVAVWILLDGGAKLLAYLADRGEGGARVELIGEASELRAGQEVVVAYALGQESDAEPNFHDKALPRGRIVWIDGVHLGLQCLSGQE